MTQQSVPEFVSSLANAFRPAAASAVRWLPNVRGKGRFALAMNAAFLAAGAEPRTVAKTSGGYHLLVDSRVHAHGRLLFTGQFEDEYVSLLKKFLRPGGMAVDVGANVGFVTVPLALEAKRIGSRVVAFEPFPGNVKWLKENLLLNQVEDLVTVVPAGLSSSPGEAQLLLAEDFQTGAKIGNAIVQEKGGPDRGFQKVSVRLETLDAEWERLGNPRLDVVKVDIEGHEDRFLEGGAKTIAAHRPAILSEVNRWYYQQRGLEFDEVIPRLVPEGYEFYTAKLELIRELTRHRDVDVLILPEEKVQEITRG